MPTAANWGYFIYVNLAFFVIIAIVFYMKTVKSIKKDWPKYRCNPMYMPLSDDIEKDFQYCMQSSQINFMGYLLQPLTFITSSLGKNASSFVSEINSIRAMFNKVREFLSTIFQSIFGVFLNMIIEFQKIIISTKDLMGKTIGILTSVIYLIQGSLDTINSSWKGPIGESVRAVGSLGKCFLPSTVLQKYDLENILTDNNYPIINVQIKDIKIGDILYNGTEKGIKVIATMIIDNKDPENKERLYKFIEKGVDNQTVYVTGTHYVFDRRNYRYVKVKDHIDSYPVHPTEKIDDSVLICLITDTHQIQIGEITFWDWDDYLLRKDF
jgi:hypothetical protein